MAASTSKKVVVYRFERTPLPGYFDPGTGIENGHINLLSPEGSLVRVPLEEIKLICFVRDFDGPPFAHEHRVFRNRPKTEGLWLRLQFRDNDFLEGLLPNNLLQLEPHGFSVVPPDASANNQRIFAPRAALKECRVLGVVGAVAAKRRRPDEDAQPGLFDPA